MFAALMMGQLLDLGLVKGRERVWRLLLARDDMLAEVSQPLAHRRIGQPIQDRCIELADDILRRAFGGPNRIPNRGVEPGQPGLVRRRDIWGDAAKRSLPVDA